MQQSPLTDAQLRTSGTSTDRYLCACAIVRRRNRRPLGTALVGLIDALRGHLELVLHTEDIAPLAVRITGGFAEVSHEFGVGDGVAQPSRVSQDIQSEVVRVSGREKVIET